MDDLVIRNGNVIDGTGAPAQAGTDVAISGGRITAVGRNLGPGSREIDAEGMLVTPGFVDIHTHYDGQATWDAELSPSSWHGVTTAVMGNCGVGFAPADPTRHDWLIELMEAVEDIPGSALAEGIDWRWESFPEYLDALERKARTIDIAAQVPHGAVRAYVMGERGADNEDPTPEEIEAMAAIVRDGVRAGALGFSTSRTMLHRSPNGEPMPGTFAGAEELMAIGQAVADAGFGVFEVASDLTVSGKSDRFSDDLTWMRELSVSTGIPVTFALTQPDAAPEYYKDILAQMAAIRGEGGKVVGQVAGRAGGLLLGLETSLHPFMKHPTYQALAHLPLAQRVAELSKPEVKAQILSEESGFRGRFNHDIAHGFHKMYLLGDPPNYEQPAESCIAEIAKRQGRSPYEVCYDAMLENEGRGVVYFPLLDYVERSLQPTYERLMNEDCVLSLADGGAHCRLICDASTPTFMLTHWARDRSRGPKIPVERAVKLQTSDTAKLYGLGDRGVLAPGFRGDVNVIDFENLTLHPPYMAYDLPANGPRLLQRADGYVATVAGGQVTFEGGEPTGALPGKLIRGPRSR